MMVQSHDNDWFYIFPCDFQLRTKKFNYHIHIAHFITRDLAHHELTQDSIDSRIFYCIAITKRLQPCLHLLYRMNILETLRVQATSSSPLQDLLLQRLRHLIIIDFLRTSANQASSFALGLASVILIFLIFVSLNAIYAIHSFSILSRGWLLSFILTKVL